MLNIKSGLLFSSVWWTCWSSISLLLVMPGLLISDAQTKRMSLIGLSSKYGFKFYKRIIMSSESVRSPRSVRVPLSLISSKSKTSQTIFWCNLQFYAVFSISIVSTYFKRGRDVSKRSQFSPFLPPLVSWTKTYAFSLFFSPYLSYFPQFYAVFSYDNPFPLSQKGSLIPVFHNLT